MAVLSHHPARSYARQRQANKLVLLAFCVAGTLLFECRYLVGTSFLTGTSTRNRLLAVHEPRGGRLAQRAAFNFDVVKTDQHTGLMVEEQEGGAVRVSTHGGMMTGHWNTILGNKELPTKGRAYWEVKIIKKPSDAWEYIGVAEPTADVTMPLTRNRKGAGWFWGATWTDSFIYTYLPMRPEYHEAAVKWGKEMGQFAVDYAGVSQKDVDAQVGAQTQNLWKGVPGTHIGSIQGNHPAFESGMVVGVDVDMDDGTLAFWADGRFLGVVKDTYGKPVDLKGKKVVPALSVYGRTTGGRNEYTVMEVHSGLEPPKRP